jgi:hypothetical protein
MSQLSKTVKFDFPRIPVLGALFLIITIFNYKDFISTYLYDTNEQLSLSLIAAAIIALGTAGVSISHLISMVLFDALFWFKKTLIKRDMSYRASYQWLESIQEHSKPLERSSKRDGDHLFENRLSIDKLNHSQIHTTLQALEMECREKSPALGIQLEYYYSLYIFFFMSAMFSAAILSSQIFRYSLYEEKHLSYTSMLIDLLILVIGLFGAIKARRIKEHLRVTLFNHDRDYVLELLQKWYQFKIN